MRALLLAAACGAARGDYTIAHHQTGEPITIRTNPVGFTKGGFRHAHKAVPHPVYRDLTESTYRSPAIHLMTGEAWFSLPDVTVMPMPQPGKSYAIIKSHFDVVDEAGRSVPLSEVYMHHWLIYDELVGSDGYNMGCGGKDTWISNVFGAGSGMRGLDYEWPEGYGYIAKGTALWSANIHFIRTEDLSAAHWNGSHDAAVKSCEECGYAPGKGPSCVMGMADGPGGTVLACCFDGLRCPVNNGKDKSKKAYYVEYKITWTQQTDAVDPVMLYVLDVYHCAIWANIKANQRNLVAAPGTRCDDKVCVSTQEETIKISGKVVWAYNHQHLGGINSTLEINDQLACRSHAIYGNDTSNAPGNEDGYLVGYDMCVKPSEPATFLQVSKGDRFKLTSINNVDESDTRRRGGSHLGIMGLFYFYISPDAAPGPPTPAAGYKCVAGACAPAAGGGTLADCTAMCGGVPPPPPAPAKTYACVAGACVAAAGGLDLKTCQMACS